MNSAIPELYFLDGSTATPRNFLGNLEGALDFTPVQGGRDGDVSGLTAAQVDLGNLPTPEVRAKMDDPSIIASRGLWGRITDRITEKYDEMRGRTGRNRMHAVPTNLPAAPRERSLRSPEAHRRRDGIVRKIGIGVVGLAALGTFASNSIDSSLNERVVSTPTTLAPEAVATVSPTFAIETAKDVADRQAFEVFVSESNKLKAAGKSDKDIQGVLDLAAVIELRQNSPSFEAHIQQ